MTANSFEESGLLFQFGPAWKVLRWDKSPYYKKVSGRGFKGVDFIGIHNDQLYLIEVKNYLPKTTNHTAIVARLASPKFLLEHITTKMDDTLRLLELVAFQLNKKWWIRAAERLFQMGMLPGWRSSTYHLWLNGDQLAREGAEKVGIILWLELAGGYNGVPHFDAEGFRKSLLQLLRNEFEVYTETIVICHRTHPGGIPECKVRLIDEPNA